ncbi:MAG: hypothetical protein ACI33N_03375 [Desulfovibrionaceae bacterium]
MWPILSLLPDSLLEWAALILILSAAFLAGYVRGEDGTRQEYEARIAIMERDRAREEQARAETVAAAEKSARERLAAATKRGNRLAAELTAATRALGAARARLNRRIRDVSETARRDCPGLPAEWVRLYNEALGLAGSGHRARGGRADTVRIAGAADASGASGTGILPDALATPEDLLAHVRDYGQYCRRMEAGYRALADYAENAHD